jgi:hypothetical protein
MHAVFVRHPAVAAYSYRTARREHEYQMVERVIDCMRRAGLDDRDAARLYRVFSDFSLGYSALDAGFASLDPATRNADLLSWGIQYRTPPTSTPTSPPSRTCCPLSTTRTTSPPPSTS